MHVDVKKKGLGYMRPNNRWAMELSKYALSGLGAKLILVTL